MSRVPFQPQPSCNFVIVSKVKMNAQMYLASMAAMASITSIYSVLDVSISYHFKICNIFMSVNELVLVSERRQGEGKLVFAFSIIHQGQNLLLTVCFFQKLNNFFSSFLITAYEVSSPLTFRTI